MFNDPTKRQIEKREDGQVLTKFDVDVARSMPLPVLVVYFHLDNKCVGASEHFLALPPYSKTEIARWKTICFTRVELE